jgi:hypothetical protein
MGIADFLTPENYRNFLLPLAGVAEAVASHGHSPGTAAQAQMGAFDSAQERQRQIAKDAQEADARALQSKIGNFQLGEMQNKSARDAVHEAALDAVAKRAGMAVAARTANSIAPNQENGQFQYGGEFKGASPNLMQAIQLDPEKGLFAALENEQKAPLVQSEIYKNLHSADAATARVDKMQDRSDIDPNAPKAMTPAQSAALKIKVQNEADKLNNAYEKETSSTKAGVNLISADLAYKGIQKTLDAKNISAADVLAVKDQLIKMVNPGYQITNTQFGHSNVGGTVDKLQNMVAGMSGKQMLTPTQKTLYKAEVARLASDLVEEHTNIKKLYQDRAHDASQRLGLEGNDTLKINARNLFDGSMDGGGNISDEDILNQVFKK